MSRYVVRRLLIAVPVIFGISLVLFTILALAPGDPFEELATNPNVPPEVRMNLRAKFGLLIALPIGTYSALRPYSLFDQVATTLAFIGFSLPTFFTGLVFILVFSLWLDWLPFIYRADIAATGWRWWWEHARQAAMPVAVLGLFQGATLTRFVRSAVLDVIRLDYVNTARAKGLSDAVTTVMHVIRRAAIPAVAPLAPQLPPMISSAAITEQIFRIPGIGSLLISSILANDTPVIMAITFVFSCLVVIFNLLADLLYGWLDPRISYR